MPQWYGSVENETIVYLGEHEDFDGASDAAEKTQCWITWIYTRESLEAFRAEIDKALK